MRAGCRLATKRDARHVASFAEWGAVLAGAVLAAALSFVLLTFGAAIGLSATSPWPNSGLSVKVIASLALFWALAQHEAIGAACFMFISLRAGLTQAENAKKEQHDNHEADKVKVAGKPRRSDQLQQSQNASLM